MKPAAVAPLTPRQPTRRRALVLGLTTVAAAAILTSTAAANSSPPWSVRTVGPDAAACGAVRSLLGQAGDRTAPFAVETAIAAGLPAVGAPDRAALDAALRAIPREDLEHYESGVVGASAPSSVRARYWRAAIAADEAYRWGSVLCDLDDIPGVTAFNEVVRATVGEFTGGRWPDDLGRRLEARFPERRVTVLVSDGGAALTITATGPLSFCARFSASEGLIPTVYAGETPKAACVAVDRFSPED